RADSAASSVACRSCREVGTATFSTTGTSGSETTWVVATRSCASSGVRPDRASSATPRAAPTTGTASSRETFRADGRAVMRRMCRAAVRAPYGKASGRIEKGCVIAGYARGYDRRRQGTERSAVVAVTQTSAVGLRSERGQVLIALMLSTGLVAIDSTVIATA